MRYSKEFDTPTGKALIDVSIDVDYVRGVYYKIYVAIKDKGKRKYIYLDQSNDYTWRALSMEDRRKSDMELYLKYVTKEQIQETAEELWQKLKPSLF